ncbi:DUF2244 domain-containing protein [Roseibium porphyridii]|uniref:DUF2244 domain-containing protein n=1 Tax=Roseibium porphyridii TaxID=2866279 RepID=A0ABY8F8F7_9HYPH|nr:MULTISPECIES: DUF2244 domain-containing protein [Stappiaceae]QFT29141.1 hypothetical protein FIV00_01460 [Labrenzia sp. THAF82]WFE90135.1 DUF2244 domain-containing protein [Roseibium sp. KMA01]
MSKNNPKTDGNADFEEMDRPFFTAVLTPHRSLGPKGFMILMVVFGLVCFVAGVLFWRIGAWPVFGFFGLDIAILWFAFRMNYRSARAFEEVVVSRNEIAIRKVGPGNRYQEYRFNPFWVRLSVDRIEDEGVVKIQLNSRGETVDLGNFLNPDDRTSFAGAMANALTVAKSGGV